MYYITVSNGLLENDHYKKMGAAVWQFMWCLDKITKIDDEGYGVVLGGKPIKLEDIPVGSRVTNSRNLQKLQKEGYLTLLHTPYGIVIKVAKAKKRFNKVDKPVKDRFIKSDKPKRFSENDKPRTENDKPNKIVTVDITAKDNTEQSSEGKDVNLVIDSFKVVNPNSFQKWFARPPMRAVVSRLLNRYGLDKILKVVMILPKTNEIPYLPTITTPLELEDKWAKLEAGLMKEKNKKLQTNGRGIA